MADSFQASGGDWLGAITSIPFQALAYHNATENQEYQRQQDRLNRQMQYDFAQNSIKWRVADAKQSGIHPLAALGISPSSASPVYSSSEAPSAMNINFGELFKAQVDLLRSETAKNDAEADVIKGQTISKDDPSGIVPKTISTPEKVGRVTEVPAQKGVAKSWQVEPNQQEVDKYEALGIAGAYQYVKQFHINGDENLRRVKPKVEDTVRKMLKKQGVDFDMNYSLVIRGDPIRGYTLDLIHHDNINDYVLPNDWDSKKKKTTLPPKYKDKHLVRPKYNW